MKIIYVINRQQIQFSHFESHSRHKSGKSNEWSLKAVIFDTIDLTVLFRISASIVTMRICVIKYDILFVIMRV